MSDVQPWEVDSDENEEGRDRECDDTCAHFDSLNQCCWQAGTWGLCLDVEEGDLCHLGYKENDDL
jgi:hypothetical protein